MNKPTITIVIIGSLSMIVISIAMAVRIRPIKLLVGTYHSTKERKGNEKQSLSDNKLLIICNLIAYIYSIPYLRRAIRIIQSRGLVFLRNIAFNSTDYASTSTLIIFQTIIAPLFVVTMLLCAVDLGKGLIVKKSILMSIANVIIYTVLFGGRYMFFQLLIFYVFSIYDGYGKSIKRLLKKRKKAIVLIVILVLVLVFISEKRSTRGIFESAYIYFCGSFSYLSYLVANNIGTDLYLLGRTQFGFLYNFIYLALAFLANIEYKGSSQIITQLTQYTVNIGNGISYNSLGTILHDFMADYGLYGCLFGVFIFGISCKYVEEMRNSSIEEFYDALHLYLLYSAVNSVFGYTFRGPGALMILIYMFVFGKYR